MFNWDSLSKGKRRKIGAWYGRNWHTILLCSYIAIFALPLTVGYCWYGFELFNDVKSPCSLILVGFTIVIFVHFQWPLITKPRIFAVVMSSKKDGDMHIPDDSKMAKKIEVSKGISLIFIRITNLGVNTYKNSGIILDFPQRVKILPSSDNLYQKTAWNKNFKIFRPGYIFFDPTLNYQTIAAREHILLPIWIEMKVTGQSNITIYFHCETRNGEASEKLSLMVK